MKQKQTIFLVVLLVCLLLMTFAGKALASGTWYYYDVTVPPFGGTVITNNQTKQYNGNCSINCSWVGGDYDLEAYLELADNTVVSERYLINDGTNISFSNTASAGQKVHMTFKSAWYDHVHIESVGYWSPDTP
jgi:hypothetical protein